MALTEASVRRYAPRFSIKINGVDLSPAVSHAITSLEITQRLNQLSSFSCSVQDTFDGSDFRWLGSDVFRFGNEVSIAIGYSNDLYSVLEGTIQNLAPQFASGIAPSFSFGGSDRGYAFLTAQSDPITFKETRDSDIVQRIAEEAGLRAQVDPTTRLVSNRTIATGGSYLDFIRFLASENGYQFSISSRTLYFERQRPTLEPTATLAWGKDLISFRPVLSTEQTVTRVIVRGWDKINKEVIEATATAGEETQRAQGSRTASTLMREANGDDVTRVVTDPPVGSTEEAQNRARSELDRASNSFMQGSAELVGAPELWPGVCVAISGLGKLFSGTYSIDGATHRIDTQGYRTSLDLRRNAL